MYPTPFIFLTITEQDSIPLTHKVDGDAVAFIALKFTFYNICELMIGINDHDIGCGNLLEGVGIEMTLTVSAAPIETNGGIVCPNDAGSPITNINFGCYGLIVAGNCFVE